MKRPAMILTAVFTLALFASCTGKKADIVTPLSDNSVIIKYEGGTVTAKDVTEFVEARLKSLNEEAVELYQRSAEHVLLNKLLKAEAEKQGVGSPEELMAKATNNVTVSDEKIAAFIKENNLEKGYKDPVTGKTRKITKEEIRGYLTQQERQSARDLFMQGLMASAKVKVMLEEPRVEIKTPKDAPILGNPKAKVVIHEFSDFQCPFCSRAKASVDQIHQHYGDKVAIVFHHLPLPSHPAATPAAIASNCANKQEKFWGFHDKAFENQRDLSDENFKKWAKELGLDMAAFEACIADPKMAEAVEESKKYAESLGVNSTPTFYVNGKKVAGAQPFQQFQRIIDAELGL
ncbi:DsbA family protein [bacterium]|nr:DsbA family protein [bacterium]